MVRGRGAARRRQRFGALHAVQAEVQDQRILGRVAPIQRAHPHAGLSRNVGHGDVWLSDQELTGGFEDPEVEATARARKVGANKLAHPGKPSHLSTNLCR